MAAENLEPTDETTRGTATPTAEQPTAVPSTATTAATKAASTPTVAKKSASSLGNKKGATEDESRNPLNRQQHHWIFCLQHQLLMNLY